MALPRRRRESRGGSDAHRARPVAAAEVVAVPQQKKRGLQTHAEIRAEVEAKKKAQEQAFQRLDTSLSGQGAETVYRDRRGLGREQSIFFFAFLTHSLTLFFFRFLAHFGLPLFLSVLQAANWTC